MPASHIGLRASFFSYSVNAPALQAMKTVRKSAECFPDCKEDVLEKPAWSKTSHKTKLLFSRTNICCFNTFSRTTM